jgi:hypothetical protein
MADAYRAAQKEADLDEQFWVGLATHLEGVAALIRERFPA